MLKERDKYLLDELLDRVELNPDDTITINISPYSDIYGDIIYRLGLQDEVYISGGPDEDMAYQDWKENK